MKNENYPWKFASVGGAVRVKIESGEDIAHLGELDRKLWTVLSCPALGLEFDEKTLKLLDGDGDGNIHVDEVIAAAQWLTRVLKNPEELLQEADELKFSDFNTDDPDGARLLSSAGQILKNLGLKKDSIALEDTADNVKIFASTKFNGDGIITPASADDEAISKLIETIAGIGSATDRSGEQGITADHVEAFYAACADFKAWKDAGVKEVFPYGDNTAAALDAVNAVSAKVDDFFMRCKLIGFDDATAGAVDVNVEKIAAIEGNLADATEEIGAQPLAKPVATGLLPLKEGLNPAWKAAVEAMASLVAPKAESLSEEQWKAIVASFAPYTAWMGEKKGEQVEALGIDEVNTILKEDRKAVLIDLLDKDKALEAEALSIEEVDKLLRLNKNFYRFLNNYVVMSDFYDLERKSIFQAGRLYIDQRSTDLCVKVAGPSPEISSLSGMYILYCACTNSVIGKSFNIAAVLTAGDVDGLREGKNAIFYDRDGVDYDAKVISIVENPLSVRQAFWTPYKKVARMISDRIDKKAAAKSENSLAGLNSATDTAAQGKAPAAPFDIAKYAGIFAAVGMALGLIGAALAGVVAAFKGITFWQFLLVVAVVLLIISGPFMLIAWRKLRRRDLGPVLNANGWAMNAKSLVSVKFGKTLTSLAEFPKLTDVDPKARKAARRKRFFTCLICLLILAGLGYWFYTARILKKEEAAQEPAQEEVIVQEDAPVLEDIETDE